jgi:hypothetical protein
MARILVAEDDASQHHLMLDPAAGLRRGLAYAARKLDPCRALAAKEQ